MIHIEKDPSLRTLARQECYKARGLYDGPLDNWEGYNTQAAEAAYLELLSPGSSPAVRKVSQEGIELIKHFESCLKRLPDGRLTSYADPGYGWKFPTIGWGTIQYPSGKQVQQGDIITQAQADEYKAFEVNQKAAGVSRRLKVAVNDDQFAALVSFAYNVGLGKAGDSILAGLADSTLLRLVNEGKFTAAADEFGKYRKSNGKVLKGLIRRRASERNLFLGKRPFIVTTL